MSPSKNRLFDFGRPAGDPRTRQRGFTLLELLVVLAILGLLIGLVAQYFVGAWWIDSVASLAVVWFLVNSAGKHSGSYRDPAAAKKEWDELKIKATAWIDDHDGKVGKLYGMRTTPDMFVIDKNGVLVYAGAIDDRPDPEGDPRKARNYVREAINELIAGGKIAVAETKSYGCGVKYSN